jgi:hypothetical protein
MTIWRTHISRWLPKATYIPTVYVKLIEPEQMLQEHASMLVLLFYIQLANVSHPSFVRSDILSELLYNTNDWQCSDVHKRF